MKTRTLVLIAPCILLLVTGDYAHAQPIAPTVGDPLSSKAPPSDATPYCADLKRVSALGATRDRFASIAGKPREGNFVETSLPLTGWKDCSLYGSGTYTCDSMNLGTAEEAERAQATTLHQIQACLGDTWVEDKNRSSPSYVVVHHIASLVSVSLSTDKTDAKEHVVRLILFLRRN